MANSSMQEYNLNLTMQTFLWADAFSKVVKTPEDSTT